ncbi:MAG: OmpA family protein [Planctomycetales bacterium]|nr:OmpA family protein [Planctomycetales bacterium]
MYRLLLLMTIAASLALTGCGRLVFKPNQQPPNAAAQAAVQQQMQTLVEQTQQYQARAETLDKDNQELEALLAQSRQQIQLISDELNATRGQLKSTTDQLLALRDDNNELRTQTSQLVATSKQRAGAEIRANNSLLKSLSVDRIPGVEVRQDGDVLRVEVAGDQVFMAGSPYLQAGSEQLLTTVCSELRRAYPEHIIGIEGHTDDGPTHSQQFPTHHHLSAAQALAVYNLVLQRGLAPESQLFVIGHGSNHPVVSNASEQGKARNRRIEFVIYPERVAMR